MLNTSSETFYTSDTTSIGYMNLKEFIDKKDSMALNESDKWQNSVLGDQSGMFKSDMNESKLILHLKFNQFVKIYSIMIEAPEENGPKTTKLFINRQTINFNDAKISESVQILEFEKKNLRDGSPIKLEFDKFEKVHSFSLFFTNNQSGSNQIIIKSITIYGKPIITTTNIKDLNQDGAIIYGVSILFIISCELFD